MAMVRKATHAGTWYPADPVEITEVVEGYLKNTEKMERTPKALICPHAGIQWSGKTAAWCWTDIQPENYDRVLLLGPSHRLRLRVCALPEANVKYYATPLGDIELDLDAIQKLRETQLFETLSIEHDQNEHSLELQFPFLARAMKGTQNWKAIPIVVGNLDYEEYLPDVAIALKPFMDDNRTLIVVSSDFCHYGERFSFTRILPEYRVADLNESVKKMDHKAIQHIVQKDLRGFQNYLIATNNTICGREPIKIFLKLLESAPDSLKVHFRHYSQSGRITQKDPSAVAYASIVTTMPYVGEK